MQFVREDGVRETIIFIETEYVNQIFENIKTGNMNNINKTTYMEVFTRINSEADRGDFKSRELFEYFCQIIENYIIDCKMKLIEESNTNQSKLIDGFLFHTKNINYLIYMMTKGFFYLGRYYTPARFHKTLFQIAMNLYKSNFYESLKDNIQDGISYLKNEEKNGNEESKEKLKNILEILEYLKFGKPKIIKEQGKIKWINEI